MNLIRSKTFDVDIKDETPVKFVGIDDVDLTRSDERV